MFYSKSTGGFYSREIHGDNMPADAVEITAEKHAALLDGQSLGKRITTDSEGRPVLSDPPAPTESQITLGKIAALEATVTDRRIREAVLGVDAGWLRALNDEIATLRARLK